MSPEIIALLMVATGWLLIFMIEKKKGIIDTKVYRFLSAMAFTLNILGATMCIIGLLETY